MVVYSGDCPLGKWEYPDILVEVSAIIKNLQDAGVVVVISRSCRNQMDLRMSDFTGITNSLKA